MGVLEIILLLSGAVIFTLSFLIPTEKKVDQETKKYVKEEARKAVEEEVNNHRISVADTLEETVNAAVDQGKRALERISNEKIMAVNEYSDTVLEEINKNHKEVVFLYDMLNDKHQNIKTTISQMDKAVKEAERLTKEELANANREQEALDHVVESVTAQSTQKPKKRGARNQKQVEEGNATPQNKVQTDSVSENENAENNHNERILKLYKEGKSKVAIAKELDLGVGEVKLVIDLFEGK